MGDRMVAHHIWVSTIAIRLRNCMIIISSMMSSITNNEPIYKGSTTIWILKSDSKDFFA